MFNFTSSNQRAANEYHFRMTKKISKSQCFVRYKEPDISIHYYWIVTNNSLSA